MAEIAVECVWPLDAALGEGPVWVAREDALWFVDIKGLAIHRFTPETGTRDSWEAGSTPGFVLPAAGGGFVAGLARGPNFFDPIDGGFDPITEVQPDLPGNRLNDGTVDPSGHLWFGTMDDAERSPTGRLFRLGDDGTAAAMGPGAVITNGPAFSPDGRVLYFVDTPGRTVHAYPVGADGALGPGRLFCEIEEGAGNPDGPSVDSDGCVWIALYGGWAARRYSPAGELLDTVRFPVANITKVAFGGADLRTAYVTTARQGLDAAALAEQPLAGGLFSFPLPVAGLPGHEVTHGL